MKFKIGDKVKVLKSWDNCVPQEPTWVFSMNRSIGYIYEIDTENGGFYRLSNSYWYIPEVLLNIKDIKLGLLKELV
ncbi:MAG: hypothetical protein ABSG25_11370 [Bryobacteraceae bacterium]